MHQTDKVFPWDRSASLVTISGSAHSGSFCTVYADYIINYKEVDEMSDEINFNKRN